MKIKLFTHTDLDGVGCAILAQFAFEKKNVNITYCNYDDVDEKISEFLLSKDINAYDKVFITDISVADDVAKAINITNKQYTKFLLLDHHPTALELNKYEWAKVQIEDVGEKVSGTSLFYWYLIDNEYLNKKDTIYTSDFTSTSIRPLDHHIFEFVEKVRKYDTWLWCTKYNDIKAKQLNDLLYTYGRERFVNKMVWTFGVFDATDKLLLELEQIKIDSYIKSKSKDLIKKEINISNKTYKVGIVFAEQYISQLGNELSKTNEDLDFIAIINGRTVSYRTVKTDIDLGKDIASIFGGGGHYQAAGSQISEDIKNKIVDLIFE